MSKSKNGRVRTGLYRPVDKLPTVTSKIPIDLRNFVDRVRDAVNGVGDAQLLTTGALKELGLVDQQLNPVYGGGELDTLPTPALVTGLTATGTYHNVVLSWDLPNYNGHAYTEIWASPIYDTSIAPGEPGYVDPATYNDLSQAQPLIITTGASFVDRLGNSKGRFYWARNINVQDRAGPFNAVGGVNAETAVDVEYLLGTLQGAISESQFSQALKDRITLIETNVGQNSNSISTLNQTTSDQATLITQVQTTANNNTAAIQTEATTRAGETGALFAQYTVKIDVNGYVAGFGLASTPVDGGGQESEFAVLADRFYIASPALGVANAPFIVQATPTTINGVSVPAGVYMDAAYIQNGTITNVKIGDASIDDAKIANLSAAKITAGTLSADRIGAGSITTDKLTVRGGQNNITPNGVPFSLEFDGWSSIVGGLDIVARDSGAAYSAMQNCPTDFMYRFGTSGLITADIIHDVYVRALEQLAVSFDYASGGVGATQELSIEVVWANTAGTTVRTDRVTTICTTSVWNTRTAKLIAPISATSIKRISVRRETSPTGYGFMTNISVKRALNDVLIEDGAITAGKIAVNSSLVDITPNGTPTSQAFDGWTETSPSNDFLMDYWEEEYDYTTIQGVPAINIPRRDQGSNYFAERNSPTDFMYRITGSGQVEAVMATNIFASEGDKFYVTFEMGAGGSSPNQTIELRYEWVNADGNIISTSVVSGQRFGIAWLPFSDTIIAPVGTMKIGRIVMRRTASSTGVFAYITKIRTRRLTSGVLIEDGAVTADKLSATAIDGKTITGITVIGGTFQSIGANYMKVTSGTPFGPNDLIEWYGEKNSTTYNATTQQAILTGLTKVNAKSWKDDNGNQYTSGTIIAGTLTVSVQNPQLTNTPSIDTGDYGSNGGQIALNVSFFGTAGGTMQTGTCPSPAPPNPTVQLRLYDVNNGDTLVYSENFTGTYECQQEGAEYIQQLQLNGSFTFYDNALSLANRQYRAEATVSNLGGYPNRVQRLSILSQEAS